MSDDRRAELCIYVHTCSPLVFFLKGPTLQRRWGHSTLTSQMKVLRVQNHEAEQGGEQNKEHRNQVLVRKPALYPTLLATDKQGSNEVYVASHWDKLEESLWTVYTNEASGKRPWASTTPALQLATASKASVSNERVSSTWCLESMSNEQSTLLNTSEEPGGKRMHLRWAHVCWGKTIIYLFLPTSMRLRVCILINQFQFRCKICHSSSKV